MLQGSALPTVDSWLWWIPTNHTSAGLDWSIPCLALTPFGVDSLLGFICGLTVPVWSYLSIFLAIHPLFMQRYVYHYQRITLGLVAQCPPFCHFLDFSQRLIIPWENTTSKQRLKSLTLSHQVSTKCGKQNGQISCRSRATIWSFIDYTQTQELMCMTHLPPSTSLLLFR